MKEIKFMSDFSTDLLFGSGEHDANMLYATRLNLPDPFIYLGTPSGKIAVVSDLEYDRARANAPADLTVRNQNEFGDAGSVLELIKKLHREFQVKEFRIPYDFPAGLAAQLHAAGITCRICEKNFFPQRAVKQEFEIDFIRHAMQVNELAMQQAFEAIGSCSIDSNGALMLEGELFTSEKLRSIIDSTLAANDAVGSGTIAAAGSQSAMPHNRGEGVIYAHTPIVIDIFPRMNCSGYYGDLTRTVVKGQAPDIVRRAFDAVKTVRDECKAMIRAGISGAEPYDHAMNRLTALGFPTGSSEQGFYGFFHGLGHGVGLEIHEAPRLSRRVKHLLQPGEIVTVEPGVYYPQWGGVRLEDIVAVRENSCECLTNIPTFLEIE